MHRRGLATVIAAGVFALAVAGSALAVIPGTLDQHHECGGTDCNLSGVAAYPHWYSQHLITPGNLVNLGQTFTAGVTGQLTEVELYLNLQDGSIPPSLDVHVVSTASGIPQSEAVLATTTVSTSGGSWASMGTAAWIPVVFASPPTVTAGTQYAIILSRADPAGSTWLVWEMDSDTGAPAYTNYPGGDALASTKGPADLTDTWASMFTILNDGGSGNADFAFRTYVAAAAPTPTPTVAPTATPAPTPIATVSPTTIPTQPPTDVLTGTTGGGTDGLPVLPVLAVTALLGIVVASRRVLMGTRRR